MKTKAVILTGWVAAAAAAFGGESWREAPDGVGGVVLVTASADGEPEFECIGYADIASKRKVTPDSRFRMASNTKGVAAATALSVVADGKLSLDDPVEKFFPSWKRLKAEKRPTLRMLLSHTAGLPFFPKGPLPGPGMCTLAEQVAKEGFVYEPGKDYRYGNWDIDVAMAMVEKATGRPFEVEMAERIFKPLGMTETTFVQTPEQKAACVTMYKLGDGDPVPTKPERGRLIPPYKEYDVHPEGGGGLSSTPRDFIKFFQMIARGGKAPDGKTVIPEDLMKEWGRKQTPASVKEPYSLGMQANEKEGWIHHGGAYQTWGEGNVKTRRARLFMVNMSGGNKAYKRLRAKWMKESAGGK